MTGKSHENIVYTSLYIMTVLPSCTEYNIP